MPATLSQRFWANPYLLLVLTTLLWAGNSLASRAAVGNISPMALTSLRWVCVCAVMPWLMRHALAAHWPAMKARWPFMLAMGALGYTAFNALMYIAGHSTTAINIGILQGSIPIFVLLGVVLIDRARIGPLQVLGVLVTLVGVAVTASRGSLSVLADFAFAPGDLWMVLACAFYAGYTIGIRRRPPMPGMVFFTAVACIACVMSLPLLAAEIAAGQFYWPTSKGWLILAFVVLGPSLVAQLTFLRAVELVGAGRAGVFVNLVPVWAPILAVALLGEPFGLYHAVALALVLGGIFIAERLGRR